MFVKYANCTYVKDDTNAFYHICCPQLSLGKQKKKKKKRRASWSGEMIQMLVLVLFSVFDDRGNTFSLITVL